MRASDLAWRLVFHIAAKRAARMDARWAEPSQSPIDAAKVRTAWMRKRGGDR